MKYILLVDKKKYCNCKEGKEKSLEKSCTPQISPKIENSMYFYLFTPSPGKGKKFIQNDIEGGNRERREKRNRERFPII